MFRKRSWIFRFDLKTARIEIHLNLKKFVNANHDLPLNYWTNRSKKSIRIHLCSYANRNVDFQACSIRRQIISARKVKI